MKLAPSRQSVSQLMMTPMGQSVFVKADVGKEGNNG